MNTPSIKKLYFKDTTFANLMRHRIFNVLLYASNMTLLYSRKMGASTNNSSMNTPL